MELVRQIRIGATLFAMLAVLLGLVTLGSSHIGGADNCYRVLFCTLKPPIICWEECRAMPYVPPGE
jgi:hypothetical protein